MASSSRRRSRHLRFFGSTTGQALAVLGLSIARDERLAEQFPDLILSLRHVRQTVLYSIASLGDGIIPRYYTAGTVPELYIQTHTCTWKTWNGHLVFFFF